MMKNQQYVIKIDSIASEILHNGGNEEALLVGLIECTNDFYRVMKTSSVTEMNMYCEKFPGFFAYAKTLENLATLISEERTRQQNSERNADAETDTKPSDKKSKNKSADSAPQNNAQSMIELQHVMSKALFEMRDLVNLNGNNPEELVPAVKLFL